MDIHICNIIMAFLDDIRKISGLTKKISTIFGKNDQNVVFFSEDKRTQKVCHDQKLSKNRQKSFFFQNLPNIISNVRGGKEPKVKSFPGLKRVLTLSQEKGLENQIFSDFLVFWGIPPHAYGGAYLPPYLPTLPPFL